MISNVSIIGMAFSGAIAVLLPIILAIVFYRFHRYRISFLFVGAAAFFFSQIILRSMLLSQLVKTSFHESMAENLLYVFVIGALSAGLFEESARYFGFSRLKQRGPTWADAVAFGIGHGGIESIVLVGISQVSNIFMAFMIRSGMFDSTIAPSLGDQADAFKAQYLETAPSLFFASGLERIAVMPVHIFLSVLVCLAVIKKRPILLLVSILLHALVNTPAVISQLYEINVWIIEAIIILIGVAMLVGTIRLKSSFPSTVPAREPGGDTRDDPAFASKE
ncbi:MAG: YhfC family intramembrane metalloprotease [Clostridiaceae bacterium]|jgi:uncharacterized membrane protein YhfC|nr:YhfC family glutamic-type intramembrane protease [Oscillospiraceae bacterium]NLO62836.1 YhfC family intramembrane metalloprotease [Clostridiaceae bacterium]